LNPTINQLKPIIIEEIAKSGGALPFHQFMQMCLYYPSLGYYETQRNKLGKTGDFYTSAHIGTVMGQCIATRLVKAAEQLGAVDQPLLVMEWGGGDGRLASAVLNTLRDQYTAWYAQMTFMGVENSAGHRVLQGEALLAHQHKIESITTASDARVWQLLHDRPTLLYANELLDAFPVHRLQYCGGQWLEIAVAWDVASQSFYEQKILVQQVEVKNQIARLKGDYKEGQQIELGLAALDWIHTISQSLHNGFVLLADYGDVSDALHTPQRMNGTYLCYRNHVASEDPYSHIGEQDMTAHVNFEWCMDRAAQSGFEHVELFTQKQFLVDNGILERLRSHDGLDPFSEVARSNRAIRQLLLSDGMSELFKVLCMVKRSK